MRIRFNVFFIVVSLTALSLLSGCAGDMPRKPLSDDLKVSKLEPLKLPANIIGRADEQDSEIQNPVPNPTPNSAANPAANPTADQGDDVINTTSSPVLMATPLDASDPLPLHRVDWMSFIDAPLQDVLHAVIADTRIALSIVWDTPTSKIVLSSVSMTNLSGDLTKVLNKLAESYGFYWRYKDGMLHIAADRQYITPVPPIADLYESLPIMVKTLGGVDVFMDKSARVITFRAGSQSFAKIRSYLELIRRDRSLIVYDTYIWEVVLNDTAKMGIDWGAFAGAAPTTALTVGSGATLANTGNLLTAGLVNATSGGTGLALNFAGSRFSMSTLIDFLNSQGNINSLSQPKIQLLSGGKATLKDEIATTYVSRVGSATISAGTVSPGSVETSQVKTGVTLEITGDVSDGTVYSDIALQVSDLLGMGSATVSGSTIALPQTASREVKTHVRVKPGDTILLAGIQYDKINSNKETGLGLLRGKQASVQRSELVIVMRPRIKYFVPHGQSPAKSPAKNQPQLPAQTRPNAP